MKGCSAALLDNRSQCDISYLSNTFFMFICLLISLSRFCLFISYCPLTSFSLLFFLSLVSLFIQDFRKKKRKQKYIRDNQRLLKSVKSTSMKIILPIDLKRINCWSYDNTSCLLSPRSFFRSPLLPPSHLFSLLPSFLLPSFSSLFPSISPHAERFKWPGELLGHQKII